MASTSIDSPDGNHLLASLPFEAYTRLLNDLELVSLQRGQVLHESGERINHVYFPITCVISLIFSVSNGASAEVAMTGNDGLVGSELALGEEIATHRAVVRNLGSAYRLRAKAMSWEVGQGSVLQRLSMRYALDLMTQMAQSFVCNRYHSIEQQLCRWLLLTLDLLPTNQISMTQEQIANMLGVRRAAVAEASGKLRAAGLIQFARGQITIVDRLALEALVCECYGAKKSARHQQYHVKPDISDRKQAQPDMAVLRELAETQLRQSTSMSLGVPDDGVRLLHELQVHQIELEIQNEELRRSCGEAEAQRKRSAEIYDFAPMGYFTLDSLGRIVDVNLAGANMLGIERSLKTRPGFDVFVVPEYRPLFNRFIEEVLNAEGKRVCEVMLLPTDQHPARQVRIEAIADTSGRECRMVVIDLFTERLAEKALFEREQYQRALLDNFGASSNSFVKHPTGQRGD